MDEISGQDIVTLCDSVRSARIIAPKTTYIMGEDIQIYSTSNIQNVFFDWTLKNVFGNITNSFNLDNCNKTNEGWYYMTASNPQCNKPKVDSVYIKVICPPATAPCTVTNNNIDFSGIGTAQYSAAIKGINRTYGMLELQGSYLPGYPTLMIYFHSYWSSKEPEDGLYTTNEVISMSDNNNIYKVYIAFISGAYFSSLPNEKVYVSHENGKLKVTLCNVKTSGSYGGPILYSSVSGSLIAP